MTTSQVRRTRTQLNVASRGDTRFGRGDSPHLVPHEAVDQVKRHADGDHESHIVRGEQLFLELVALVDGQRVDAVNEEALFSQSFLPAPVLPPVDRVALLVQLPIVLFFQCIACGEGVDAEEL